MITDNNKFKYKARVGILLSGKIDFKVKLAQKKRSLCNDKGVNTSERYKLQIFTSLKMQHLNIRNKHKAKRKKKH